jgi:hypothetical protein
MLKWIAPDLRTTKKVASMSAVMVTNEMVMMTCASVGLGHWNPFSGGGSGARCGAAARAPAAWKGDAAAPGGAAKGLAPGALAPNGLAGLAAAGADAVAVVYGVSACDLRNQARWCCGQRTSEGAGGLGGCGSEGAGSGCGCAKRT